MVKKQLNMRARASISTPLPQSFSSELHFSSMSEKRKQLPSPLIVAPFGCSKIKSCLSLCRPLAHRPPSPLPLPSLAHRQPSPLRLPSTPFLQNPTSNSSSDDHPAINFRDGRSSAQAYWRRARQLERELNQLDKWLSTEKSLRDCLNNNKKNATEAQELHHKSELLRLEDGSYLHGISRMCRPWGRVAVMQVSAPAIVENGSTASEVLHRMASMRVEDLRDCLVKSVPMHDIRSSRPCDVQGKPVLLGSESGFLEAIVLRSIEKLEVLAMEGLRIQMCPSGRTSVIAKKFEKVRSDECVVLVMLIQIRDANESYKGIGEVMIGLIEASAADVAETAFRIEGVHVAGIKSMNNFSGGEDFMWSASVEGFRRWDSCCWKRNPDLVFDHTSV